MNSAFVIELVRRIGALLCLTAALIGGPQAGWLVATAFCLLGIFIYLFVPRSGPPPDAEIYERIPSVYGPDFLGLFMTAFFVALPFWARMGDDALWAEFGVLVHPAALLTWPLALVTGAILLVAAHYASYWLLFLKDGIRISDWRTERDISWSDIREVTPYRRGLPKWMKWLTPLLVLRGHYGSAGALLLARDTVGMALNLKDGTTIAVVENCFEKPYRILMRKLVEQNIPIAEGLHPKRRSRPGKSKNSQ